MKCSCFFCWCCKSARFWNVHVLFFGAVTVPDSEMFMFEVRIHWTRYEQKDSDTGLTERRTPCPVCKYLQTEAGAFDCLKKLIEYRVYTYLFSRTLPLNWVILWSQLHYSLVRHFCNLHLSTVAALLASACINQWMNARTKTQTA